jgi:3-hydroxyisobutyrate dehydrogenase-like beta-hydroxyacid dehydrogenase
MSTVSPKTSLKVARRAAEKEVLFLRAPVSGSTKFAEAGTLTIFISGPEWAFEECREVLQVLGQEFFYLGAAEEARSLKLLVNMMVGTTAMMVAEALIFGRKSGLDWATMIDAINQSVVASPLIGYKAQALKDRNFTPVFAAKQIAKDFDLALETGKALNLPLPVTALVRQFYAAMEAGGKGDLDYFAMVTLLEELAGIPKER